MLHEFNAFMGHKRLGKYATERQELAVIANMLPGMAPRFKVWRRIVMMAGDNVEHGACLILQSPKAKDAALELLMGIPVPILTPAAYLKSVNQYKKLYCPVCPSGKLDAILDALLQADELHTIRSDDYAQERFLKELRQRAATRRSTLATLTYREGR